MTSRPGPEAAELAPGVRELDHTADVGIAITAADPTELFRRAAVGMVRLMREVAAGRDAPRAAVRALELTAGSIELLLVSWLSELLYLDEVEGFVFDDAVFDAPVELEAGRLRASISGHVVPDPPERQLKGVTYHGLRIDRAGDDWEAEVIFDI